MSVLRLLLVLGLLGPPGAVAADVAVVIERQHWKAGGRVYLVLRESGAPQKDLVLRHLYRMNDLELKQFWLGKLYRGEIASFPRVVSSDAMVKRIVAQAPNAIGFIDAGALDGTVKVLRIAGRRPGESGYLLSATGR
jgi:hypothetical protein